MKGAADLREYLESPPPPGEPDWLEPLLAMRDDIASSLEASAGRLEEAMKVPGKEAGTAPQP